ncbi:MAG TPA: PhzF family phenazine biosynthesis protein [Steroidobacteraceae bacterium]|nr:PhzF family phenazine biosynthesis protein [Steroidobacteraceae bacterium]
MSYRIVNVFTQGGDRLSGNPLCVFENGSALDTQAMQALALQFNLSETTFILPSSRASAGVRIFTPRYEMPFAGHPTLGTAHVCRALGRGGDALTLDMPAGIIPVKASGGSWTLEAAARGWREVEETRSLLADMLGVVTADIGERPLWVNAGREQMVIPLTSEAAVRKVVVRPELLARLRGADGAGMAYVFAQAGEHALARFFFTQGVTALEDPATGSAATNFGGWWLAMGRPLPAFIRISQGEYTGRPSLLHLHVDDQRRIFVSGEVIELGRGTIDL